MTREEICQQTSRKLAAAMPTLPSVKATIGLDGFVDEIIAVVDKRFTRDKYQPVKTIATLGARIVAAAGKSSNYELVVTHRKLGGNGPIMANALACAGINVTYIGNLGHPQIDPVFAEFASRANVISIADAGHTDALEFEDGKLMLGKHQSLGDVSWENLIGRIGKEKLTTLLENSQLIGMVNWTMLPMLSDIWEKLSTEIFPNLKSAPRYFFADLCDPQKREATDLMAAMKLLTKIQKQMNVILGLNLSEAQQVSSVLGLVAPTDAEAAIEQTAIVIRQELGLHCVVVHPRKGAAAATEKSSAKFAGPFVQHPKISTGAGDHFNAGFCLASVLGFELAECLAVGCATSGYYVRTAISPSAADLVEFLAKLPAPQG